MVHFKGIHDSVKYMGVCRGKRGDCRHKITDLYLPVKNANTKISPSPLRGKRCAVHQAGAKTEGGVFILYYQAALSPPSCLLLVACQHVHYFDNPTSQNVSPENFCGKHAVLLRDAIT